MTISFALFMNQDDARCFYYHLSVISGHPRGSVHHYLPFTDEEKDSGFQQLAQHTCPVCETQVFLILGSRLILQYPKSSSLMECLIPKLCRSLHKEMASQI